MSIPFNDVTLELDGGDVTVTDNGEFINGSSTDLRITHDATDSKIISKTGNFVVDNSTSTGSTIMKLGTDTTATNFQVQNSSAAAKFTVDGTGDVTFDGTLINPQPYSERQNNGNQTLITFTNSVAKFDTVVLERGITYSSSGGTDGYFTVPTDGIYKIEYNTRIEGRSGGERISRIILVDNGDERRAEFRVTPNHTDNIYLGGSDLISMSAGDSFYLYVAQFSGISLILDNSFISIMRMVGS